MAPPSAFTAFLIDHAAPIRDQFVRALRDRIPLYRALSDDDLLPSAMRFVQSFLQGLITRSTEPTAKFVGDILVTRLGQGMTFDEAMIVSGVLRRMVLQFALPALEQKIQGVVEDMFFVEEVLDAVDVAVTSFYRGELERTRRALAESERRYRWVFTSAPAMLHCIDASERLIQVSDRWLEVLGYERQEVLGRHSTDFLTEASRNYARTVVLPEFFRVGWCKDIHYRFVKKSGEQMDVLLSAVLARDDAGEPLHSVAIVVDISSRARAERALSESEERYRGLLDLSPDGVAVLREGRFLYANPAAVKMLGAGSLDQLHGASMGDFLEPDLRQIVVERLDAAERGEQPRLGPMEMCFLRPDNESLIVEVLGGRVNFGELPALQIVFRDISERKRAERAIELTLAQSEVIRAQAQALRELSTPLIPVSDGAVVMPLVGAIDPTRADQMRAVLLEGVMKHSARVAILDLTGVPSVDADAAEALLAVGRALKLLGAEVVFTGIKPKTAQAFVEIGAEFEGVVTKGTLKDGIAWALRRKA